ncbi:MAG: hypothetical protein CND85_00380 [Marine Group II euryarchaeote MED-G33]|nr:MAG: hypothetical protein CND85_00380 [Marine Group II euryarchaeote MED-G33]|tara:strand:+ start:5843 stop:7513 length:1671 start_codon:yes stop_codon:yes gene_type:complete
MYFWRNGLMRAWIRGIMGAEKISTEDALDLLAPSDDAISTEEAISATQKPSDGRPTLSDIDAVENRMEKLRGRERHLLRLDRLFLSRGIHLSLTLPIFALALQLVGRRYAEGSPDWWISSVESGFPEATLSIVSGLLATIILLAWMVSLSVVRSLHNTSRKVFLAEGESFMLRGRPFESLHGYEAINDVTRMAITRVSGVLTIVTFSAIAQLAATLEGGLSDAGGVLVGFAIGGTFAAIGLDLLRGGTHHNTVERWGLLEAYEPPLHPSCPDRVFTEILTTWMDPVLRARFDAHIQSLRDGLQPGKDIHSAIEHLLHMRYLEAKGELTNRQVRQSMEHYFRLDRLPELFENDWFDEETWTNLFLHVKGKCSPFFRLLSRLQHDLSDDLESLRADTLHFDVDMQNVVSGSGHLFAYLHNSGEDSRKIVIKVQTPDFQPHESSFTLTLESSTALEGLDAHLPTRSSTTDDVHDVLARMMGHGEIIWQTLLPQHDGESTVTVRLEDTEGNLLGGKVLAVQVRPKLQERIRLRGGMAAVTAGILAVLYRVVPWVASLAAL